uniref:Methyltransf_25 domain-containing protein n=1 Tax=Caenorhabditis japonica TaxID=281687 RepID=A0A8R1I0J2_CAEJA
MTSRLAKLFTNSFKLATSDLANQYALPVKSMTGHVVSKYGAASSRRLNEKVVEQMRIDENDFIFEIGFGRGDALKMCFERVSSGRGMVFGVERSGYMDEVARKRFILEIAETDKIRIDSAIDLRNLPYPTDLFNHIFHVDVFYFLRQDHLVDITRELFRVLKPGGSVTCGMQFSRLEKLTEHRILEQSQWDPMRCLQALEAAHFSDVQINYHKDAEMGEYQIISARKSLSPIQDLDPEELMRQLAMDMKKERLAVAMMNNKKEAGDC